MFGVGSPMNDSFEPSVPPRIGRSWTVHAGAADRLAGVLDDVRMVVEHLAHVAILLFDRDLDPRAVRALPSSRELLEHLLLVLHRRGLEVADDEADGRLPPPPCRTYGWTKPSYPSVASGDMSRGSCRMKSAATLIELTRRSFA